MNTTGKSLKVICSLLKKERDAANILVDHSGWDPSHLSVKHCHRR